MYKFEEKVKDVATITIIGAGMMGTALCWPLRDNGQKVRLVGTFLDVDIINSLQLTGYHPTLQRQIPEGVQPYFDNQIEEALFDADLIVVGVNSLGVDWFAKTVGPYLHPGSMLIAVTKGLEDLPDGDLQIIPEAIMKRLPPGLQGQVSINAIGGPCIAHELAARRHTGVVFCGQNSADLQELRLLFATSYYHIWISTDVIGVEVCAALKNAYAMGVALAVGMMEQSGLDGLAAMYNPQAAIFAQSCFEMRRMLQITGGGVDNIGWLPAPGDLFVTVFGGRTLRLGRLLGQGFSFNEALSQLAGVTLESVEIITRIGRALNKLEARGIVQKDEFPLIRHLDKVINTGTKVNIPWDAFFAR